jgi:hypothetical protein
MGEHFTPMILRILNYSVSLCQDSCFYLRRELLEISPKHITWQIEQELA